jgi:peptidoglycan/LPS O-acetylase OafA/YrhL
MEGKSAPAPSLSESRLRQLDGVRGCAILLVLVWHYYCCQVRATPGSFAYEAGFWLRLTWSGVDLFFVLSGFLITGILLDNRDASNYFSTFYIRRACRILPLYYVFLFGFVITTGLLFGPTDRWRWVLNEPLPLWSHATFTQNILMGSKMTFGSNWLGATWSLAVEEQFYLVLPLLVYFLPRRVLPILFLGLICSAVMLRAYATNRFQAYVGAPWRADSLMTGALLAWCVRNEAFLGFVTRHRLKLYPILAALAGGAVLITWRGPRHGAAFDHVWLACLCGVFILAAYVHGEGWFARCLRWPVLVWFGTLSYGIYLFHQPISGLLHACFGRSFPRIHTGRDALVTLLALALTLGLAAISFYGFERRIVRFGHRFTYRRGELAPVVMPQQVPIVGK